MSTNPFLRLFGIGRTDDGRLPSSVRADRAVELVRGGAALVEVVMCM